MALSSPPLFLLSSCVQKIREAMTASLQVLRNGRLQPFTQRELLRAKRTLLTRHESDLKVGHAI